MAKQAVVGVLRRVRLKVRRPGRHAKKARRRDRTQTFFTGGRARW